MTKFFATIGVFDGLHRGHQFLLEELKRLASELALQPLVVTFDNTPSSLFTPERPTPLLTCWEEKQALLQEQGLETCCLHFDANLAQLTAQEFLQQLHDRNGVQALLMGYDHCFGSDQADFRKCQSIARALGIDLFRAPVMPADESETPISSTRIRQLVRKGMLPEAAQLLGHPYTLRGTVQHGYGNGHKIGFPTANLLVNPEKCLPPNGVYAAQTAEGQPAICNIGCRPTITPADPSLSIEVHIPCFTGDLYGQTLQVELMQFLRPERKFEHPEELIKQIQIDLDRIKNGN